MGRKSPLSVTAPFPLPRNLALLSCSCPTEPTEKRWPASHSQARCRTTLLPNVDSAHYQMSDVQARHEPPFRDAYIMSRS